MFDVGFFELLLISVISLIVLGPERLPKAARTVGRWVGKARATVSAFKTDIDRELQLEEMRAKLEEHTKFLQDAKSAIAQESHALAESANSIHQDMKNIVDSDDSAKSQTDYKPYPEDGSDDALALSNNEEAESPLSSSSSSQTSTANAPKIEDDYDPYFDVPPHEPVDDEEDVVINHYELAQEAQQNDNSRQQEIENKSQQHDVTKQVKSNEPNQP